MLSWILRHPWAIMAVIRGTDSVISITGVFEFPLLFLLSFSGLNLKGIHVILSTNLLSKPLQSIVCVLGIVLGPGIEHSPFPHGAYVLFVKSLCDSAFMSCELPSDNS